mgnify:CR=1 FL=1
MKTIRVKMSMPKITSDFKAMNMAQLKKTCKGSRRFSTRIFKTFARGNRFCSRTNGFTGWPKLWKRWNKSVMISWFLIHFPTRPWSTSTLRRHSGCSINKDSPLTRHLMTFDYVLSRSQGLSTPHPERAWRWKNLGRRLGYVECLLVLFNCFKRVSMFM